MIYVPVSVGELVDKLTILSIKMKKIEDESKLENISKEYGLLHEIKDQIDCPGLEALENDLEMINELLWTVEDEIRQCDREKSFQTKFIALARSVYQLNDWRSNIKRKINILCRSELIEEKSY